MTKAYLSELDRLSAAQRSLVTHWIIDDPDNLSTREPQPSTADIAHDIDRERREGWLP